ncbi:DUF1016 N-terminal domain-containing protein [Selenomonas sp. AB3002]|uniref:DUF1016 N-terminal domain-containing protein n=1 Tax=Selenomonas sp. AB3002 TaxID=1392502 RepID=UPI000907094C
MISLVCSIILEQTSIFCLRGDIYLAFPIGHAVSDQLSWTHYRMLLKVENEQERDFYAQECAKSGWSTRQLER